MTARVGQSGRTLWKHTLLNAVIGGEMGAFNYLGAGRSYTMLDLCAGDGRPADASGESSPGILLRHRDLARRNGSDVRVVLVERNASTFATLEQEHPGADHLIHGDSREPGTVPVLWRPSDYVFVHNDPNSIADFALAPELVAALPRFTTTLSTLGCNVGGLKRLPLSERQGWYEHVNTVTRTMGYWHDAMLVRVDRDDAQWAYLLTWPAKWRHRANLRVAAAFRGVEVDVAWARQEPHLFAAVCDLLFLQKKERSA